MTKRAAQPPHPAIDVVVVGGGPVGAFCALLLRSLGMRCLVIERDQDVCDYPRAVCLDGDAARLVGLVSPHLSAWLQAHVLPCSIDIRNGSPCGKPPAHDTPRCLSSPHAPPQMPPRPPSSVPSATKPTLPPPSPACLSFTSRRLNLLCAPCSTVLPSTLQLHVMPATTALVPLRRRAARVAVHARGWFAGRRCRT